MSSSISPQWKAISSTLTSTTYIFPPSASVPLAGQSILFSPSEIFLCLIKCCAAIIFRVTASSFGGVSLPSTPSPPLLVALGIFVHFFRIGSNLPFSGSVRSFGAPTVIQKPDNTAYLAGQINVIGTETITCNITTVAPSYVYSYLRRLQV